MASPSSRLYAAPPMERREFSSWDEFFSYMEEYQQKTDQTFSRRTATSVKTRNQVLMSAAGAGRALPSQLLPESFLDYVRMLQCSHKLRGQAARSSARWNGVQPSECQARVNATLQLCEDGKYRIRVTKVNLQHNHPIGENVSFVRAPQTAASAQEEGQVAKRRRVGRPPKNPSVYELSEAAARQAEAATASRVPTMADVCNFLERVKRTRSLQPGGLQSVEERLAAYVNEFAAQEGNAAKIFVDDEKVLSSITLQTQHMRKVFEAFPEVLRVDAMPAPKEGAADSNYRVFSLMAHDTFGNWQYVQHAITESDRLETLRVALDQFKANNARHPRVRALIVPNGDLPELKELHAGFPTARVLYSQFHVVRALHKAIAAHGQDLTSWHRDRLTGIAQLLVYAPTSVVYGANIAMMVEVLGSKQHSFFTYFLEKWDSCRDRWTTFARESVTTFSMSEDDDQFAPTWKGIFAAGNQHFGLDETVAAIRYYQAVVERAFMQNLDRAVQGASSAGARQGPSSNDEYDAEMRLLAATVSPAVCSLIFPQYRYAIARGAYQFCEPSRGSFFVSAVSPNDVFCDEPSKEFCVEADRGWQCSCAFMVNHHLPCRHVFYIRRIVRCDCVIPMEDIKPRWVLAKTKHFFASRESPEASQTVASDLSNVIGTPGAWQKFVSAQEVGRRISQRMMEMEPEEFNRALHFYKLVETTMNVRPFDLNAAAVARLNTHAGGFARTAAHRPNWVEPDPRRVLAPRGVPLAGGAMHVSARDYMAAAAAGLNARRAPAVSSAPQPQATEVIDLQDDTEEEEKENGAQGESATAATTSSSSGQAGKDDSEPVDHSPEDLDGVDAAASSSSNDNGDDGARGHQSPTHNEEQQATSPPASVTEPWEVIDAADANAEAASLSPPRSPSFGS